MCAYSGAARGGNHAGRNPLFRISHWNSLRPPDQIGKSTNMVSANMVSVALNYGCSFHLATGLTHAILSPLSCDFLSCCSVSSPFPLPTWFPWPWVPGAVLGGPEALVLQARALSIYMRNLLGWLKTRLAQSTLNYLEIA